MAYMIPLTLQQIEWYSFPIGCGFHGKSTHMFVQTDMDTSSKHDTQLGLKHAGERLLKASIRSLTGWKGSLNAGRGFIVNVMAIVKIFVSHCQTHLLPLRNNFFLLSNDKKVVQYILLRGVRMPCQNNLRLVKKLLADGDFRSDTKA